jgi:hypothetical protein
LKDRYQRAEGLEVTADGQVPCRMTCPGMSIDRPGLRLTPCAPRPVALATKSGTATLQIDSRGPLPEAQPALRGGRHGVGANPDRALLSASLAFAGAAVLGSAVAIRDELPGQPLGVGVLL